MASGQACLCGARQASATARRHGIATSLLFKWRKAYREGHLGAEETPTFMPAVITPEAPASASSGPSPRPDPDGAGGRMEIVAASGRRVIVGADVDPAALARVLDVLEGR
jgi:transposase